MEKNEEVLVVTAEKISGVTGFSPEQVAVIKSNVAKGTTNNELAYFVSVCKTTGLDPLAKEIWCYKDHRNNLLIFAGRDGFLKKAQQNPKYNGIRSVEVCEKDEVFTMDIPNGVVDHKFDPRKQRGKLVGAYAIVFRADGEPTIEWADFGVYGKKFGAWSTHPAEMIKKVAESHALKKAFGISGLQSEYDYKLDNGVATPVETQEVQDSRPVLEKGTKKYDDAVEYIKYGGDWTKLNGKYLISEELKKEIENEAV